MPKNRWIKPFYFKLEALADAEAHYQLPLRYALLGLMTCCDRDGLFSWRPHELKATILPYDNIDFNQVLNALKESGFIKQYWNTDKIYEGYQTYGCIVGWRRFQTIRRSEAISRLPPLNNIPHKIPSQFTSLPKQALKKVASSYSSRSK